MFWQFDEWILRYDGGNRREDPDALTSNSLLRRAQQDEPDAWTRLVELYSPLVLYWCRDWGVSGPKAEELVQDSFCSVAAGLRGFRKERPEDSFRGWLRVIARRRFVDLVRQNRHEPGAIGGEVGQQLAESVPDSPGDDQLSWEKRFVYERAVQLIRGQFNEQDWQAFFDTAVSGKPAREVADTLEMSVNSVYLARSRIARYVRDEFAELIDD